MRLWRQLRALQPPCGRSARSHRDSACMNPSLRVCGCCHCRLVSVVVAEALWICSCGSCGCIACSCCLRFLLFPFFDKSETPHNRAQGNTDTQRETSAQTNTHTKRERERERETHTHTRSDPAWRPRPPSGLQLPPPFHQQFLLFVQRFLPHQPKSTAKLHHQAVELDLFGQWANCVAFMKQHSKLSSVQPTRLCSMHHHAALRKRRLSVAAGCWPAT